MRKLLVKARTRVGAVVIGGALLAVAVGGVATAAVIDNPPADEVSDVEPVTTPAAETPAEPTDAVELEVATNDSAAEPAESPAVVTPSATVDDVPKPETKPEIVDPESIGSAGPDGNYTPAPPRQNPGEPPAGSEPEPSPVEPLPGEPGYVAPQG